MNWSKYFIYFPYRAAWSFSKLFRKKRQIDFLCGNIVDYICFKNIHEKMPEVRIIARNKKVKKELLKYGVKSKIYPSFPDVIIMARHLTRKFPEKKIVKIGMRHGAYHFKDFINKDKYNAFDCYFVTSKNEQKCAEVKGITSSVPIGFPKMDKAFSKENSDLEKYIKKLKIDSEKKIIIFSATWAKKGYAAIDKWYDKLDKLTNKYNVLVTVHPWTSNDIIEVIKNTDKVKYIDDKEILPYLQIADLMVGDTSSILGEFCALDKPIITFEIPLTGRITKETKSMLEEFSYRIKDFEELLEILPKALANPDFHKTQREKYNRIMFDELDGKASERAVKVISKTIREKI